MDKRGSNIDIVFRNGLKDYEVLPPPAVWDNIHSVIKPKQKSFILIRSAAMIAVLVSVSYLVYQLSLDAPSGIDNQVASLNIEVAGPLFSSPVERAESITAKLISPVKNFPIKIIEVIPENIIVSEIEKTDAPPVAKLQETNSFPLTRSESLHGPSIAFKAKEPLPLYYPESIPEKTTERWSVAAMASPTYYSRINTRTSDISKQLMASEKPLISYSAGVSFGYKVSKRFSVQSGLYYSSLDQKVDGINSFGGFQKYNDETKGDHNFEVLTSNGSVFTSNTDIFLIAVGPGERIVTNYTSDVFDPKKANLTYINNSLNQNFSYLELPVLLKYKVIDKAIDINLIGGMSYNLLVNNLVYTNVDGGKYPVGKTEELNLLTVSSSLGMGMEYNFSDKLSLNLEPTFRYYLNPFNGTTSSRIHPYSFGIFSGVSYRF